jgi:quinol monooxygenase YgiN
VPSYREHATARIEQLRVGMIIGTVRILPPADRRADILEVLRSVQGRIQDQPGCSACRIYEEDDAESAIVFVERWTSDEALEAHLRSDIYRRILSAVELSASPPDISFEHVSATEGIEVIERSRDPARTARRTAGQS